MRVSSFRSGAHFVSSGDAVCWCMQVNVLHDKEALDGVANAAHKDVPDVVHSYFGPYIGVYFAWLSYYTK